VSDLSDGAAEAWCLQNLALPVAALAGEKPWMLKLQVRVEEARAESNGASPRISVAGLIDVFSRKPKEEPLQWSAVSGPFRLRDLFQK
jgi:hypothetical protein